MYITVVLLTLGCSSDREAEDDNVSEDTFRLSKLEAEEVLREHLKMYEEMHLQDLVNQFGGGYAIIRPESDIKSKYSYSINTDIFWANEEARSIEVNTFLIETESGSVETSTIIVQKNVVLYR